ncbi:dihydroxyacetone kinase, phosphotransfer subunit [Enterococcus sp. 7E2_DIV0204]|uniref:phosphoenolpyruvate--glycerone phosphotransferase n=1 Tax=Candidatus Enterococcus lemimoniae TaxID=1834167 RepID=A0ABZ2T6L1_9ENTE|nr:MULTISPECIES: dihydroxyacetone kinase phosphoryl donor subunit DhaM [unclassified Enterococcus]OTN89383.1 dihydroxyacetone kinase, phosphotransfer subunit [Enterococcus sp. 7E2_DIV0204]OTO68230.1 dihydroxyacetone kinase, phosphotransfer subunit [Enterococcus sp. 12C11_DIV0727]OTP51837.1 dihydroxyacetone kinase, phosphotransfer subunit [Enterococcus sp. 7D2_DIV0200]
MFGIILVSHSQKITDGTKEMIEEMTGELEGVRVISAGGTGDGRLGTNSVMIMDYIEACQDCDHILIFCDIGSAILSSETAIDLIEDDGLKGKVEIMDCPLVEGAFAAAVQASVSQNKQLVVAELSHL